MRYILIGDSFVDLLCYLQSAWPEPGGDARLSHPVQTMAGGSATNTATHLCALSPQADVALHSVYNAADEYGMILRKHADEAGYTLHNCTANDNDTATGHCLCIVANQDRSFMTHLGVVENFKASDIDWKSINTEISSSDKGNTHVHIAGYFNIPGFWHGRLAQYLKRLKEQQQQQQHDNNLTISLVTQHDYTNEWNGGLADLLPLLDYIFVNEIEAKKVESILQQQHCNSNVYIITTRGPNGAVITQTQTVVAEITKSAQVDVIDPTGAGDAFIAGFLYGLDEYDKSRVGNNGSNRLQFALNWACAVGSAKVTTRGASSNIDPATIQSILEQQQQQQQQQQQRL